MKILILSDSFPPFSSGGADRVAYNLTRGFKKHGHDVLVITTVQEKKHSGWDGKEKIWRFYSPQYPERFRSYFCLYNPFLIFKVKKVIKKFKPDLVNIHNIHYYLSYAVFKVAKKYSSHVFLTAHDTDLFQAGKLKDFSYQLINEQPAEFNYRVSFWQQYHRFKKRFNPWRRIVINHYLKFIDLVLAVSQELKTALQQNGIKKKIEVVHNGLNLRDWTTNDEQINNFREKNNLKNKNVVMFGGRISPLKGGEAAIKILIEVTKTLPNTILLIVGKENDYLKKIKAIAKNSGVNVCLTGWISGEDLISAYYVCDLLLVPSLYLDPFPTVNLEAMACRKPVVGTCFGGTKEVVQNDQTGYIINPNCAQTTAAKIISLLKDKTKAQHMGQAGYERVKNIFSLEKQVEKIMNYTHYGKN